MVLVLDRESVALSEVVRCLRLRPTTAETDGFGPDTDVSRRGDICMAAPPDTEFSVPRGRPLLQTNRTSAVIFRI